MNLVLKYMRTLLIIIISLTIVFLVNGGLEMLIVKSKIENFKERSQYIGVDPYRDNIHYYRVIAKYDYEDTSRNIFNKSTRYIGSKTDIIVTNRNPMRDAESTVVKVTVGFLAQNFYLGHATMNTDDLGARMIETVGNNEDPQDNVVIESTNTWLKTDEYLGQNSNSPMIIGLRIKNTDDDFRNKMVDYAKMQLGKTYNYTFLFNRANTFYCTDLVSRSARKAGININYDYLATTGNDLIVSRNVYIIFIRETVYENGVKRFNYYYLE